MSAYYTVCKLCGKEYFHMFVGNRLLSSCPCSKREQVQSDARELLKMDEHLRSIGK